MKDQITRLREHPEQLRPPATTEELTDLQAVLGVERLPGAVLALYADHGGMDPARTSLPMRLLSPADAADAIKNWREFGVPFEDRSLESSGPLTMATTLACSRWVRCVIASS